MQGQIVRTFMEVAWWLPSKYQICLKNEKDKY